MSRRIAVVGLLIVLLGGVASARHIMWKPQEKPPVALKEALELAEGELAKREGEFHCLSAKLAKTFTGGDWELTYSTPDGKPLWISVGSDKSVRASTEGFSY
jgi:hypothetical protein